MKSLNIIIIACIFGFFMGLATCNSCRNKIDRDKLEQEQKLHADSVITITDTVPVFTEAHSEIQAPQPTSVVTIKTRGDSYPVYINKDSFILLPIDTPAIISEYIKMRGYSQAYPLAGDTVRVQNTVQGNKLIGQAVSLSHRSTEVKQVQTVSAKPKPMLYLGGSGYFYKGQVGIGAGAMYQAPNKKAFEGGIIILPNSPFYYVSYKVPLWK